MFSARFVLCGLTLCLFVSSAQAQKADLTEAKLVDRCYQVTLAMEMTNGQITIERNGQQQKFNRSASARHEFTERILDEKEGLGSRAVRVYKDAWAEINDGNEKLKLTLGKEKSLAVASRVKENVLVYSPRGSMTREEMEVTEHFDSLAVPGLLPGKEVSVGEKWTVAKTAVQALCYLDGLEKAELTAQLESVQSGTAKIALVGTVSGIDKGSQVVLLVQGHCLFDTSKNCIVEMVWRQSDQRQQGPVSPAMSADVVISLKRTPIAEPEMLSNSGLRGVLQEPVTTLLHREAMKGTQFEFQHTRDWHIVNPKPGQVILRLLERGDFVAQCTITDLNLDAKNMTLAEFQKTMSAAQGWAQEEIVGEAKTDKAKSGNAIHRFTAQGKLSGTPVVQTFCLVVGADGTHRLATFTMLPNQVKNLDGRDMALVETFRFAPPTVSGN